jgi:hypothetical protein
VIRADAASCCEDAAHSAPRVSIGDPRATFNPAPGWPPAPEGWLPPAGWLPDPSWPRAPKNWALVVPDARALDGRPAVATLNRELGADAAPLRPDIEAAIDRMGRRLGIRRELRRLEGKLDPEETVEDLARVERDGHGCLLVITRRRLMFIREGMVRSSVEEVPIRMLTSVTSKRHLVNGELVVTVAGEREKWPMTSASHCERVSDTLRGVMRGVDAPTPAPVPKPVDAVDQLHQLGALRDAGIVTAAEFEAKKTELLARL